MGFLTKTGGYSLMFNKVKKFATFPNLVPYTVCLFLIHSLGNPVQCAESVPLLGDLVSVTEANGAQQFPDVAYNTNENSFLIVWEHAFTSDIYEIWGVIFDGTTHQPVGIPILLLMDEQSLEAPEIAYNSTDNEYVLVVRRESDNMVLGQRISAQGQPVADPAELGISNGLTFFDAASRARVASIAYNARDNRYIVGFGEPISVQILHSDLSPDWISNALGSGTNPAVSWSSQSNIYLVAYEDRENRSTGSENLSAILISDIAEPLSDVIHIRDQEYAEESPRIAYNPDENQFLVIWDERIGFSGSVSPQTLTDTIGQIVASDGTLVGNPIPIEAGTAYTLRQDVDYNPTNEVYLVVWKGDPSGDFAFADIYGRFINGDGTLNGETFLIYDGGDENSNNDNSEQYFDESKLPVVAANSQTGSFLVVWEEGGITQDPESRNILSRSILLPGTPVMEWAIFE